MLGKGIEGFSEKDETFPVIITPMSGKVWRTTMKGLAEYAEVRKKKLEPVDMMEDRKIINIEERVKLLNEYHSKQCKVL